MISHRYRAIFIHQRKAGGTSVIGSFGVHPSDPQWHAFNEGTQATDWPRRNRSGRGYVVFTVVRNP